MESFFNFQELQKNIHHKPTNITTNRQNREDPQW